MPLAAELPDGNKYSKPEELSLPLEPEESAKIVGLRYVTAGAPGIRRVKCGKGWKYLQPGGHLLRDCSEFRRIRALVIPPAWSEVWICPYPNGHLQAIGIDQRGRRQYRYHTKYREIRDATKFTRMVAFGQVLPKIRERVEEDLRLRGLPREKVVATAVRLLETTSVRVGNEEYVKQNDSFGLTTLRNHHAKIEGGRITFRFRGKSGQQHEVEVHDSRLARIVRNCQDLPGQELFQFTDEAGETCHLASEDVNRYLKDLTGAEFTAKDFRTWNGTREALASLNKLGQAPTAGDAKKAIVEAVKQVAAKLGNRPATCRKYYIHPAIFESYAGRLAL